MDRVSKAINKYCEHYAEAEVRQLRTFPADRSFKQVIVVPAYNESPDFVTRLQKLAEDNAGTLVILVINQPNSCRDSQANSALRDVARQSGRPDWNGDQLELVKWRESSGLLIVDRFNAGFRIPDKQGVGLARKIGSDIAVALRQRCLLTASFIHTTDADATLPSDYLLQTRQITGASAALYPFWHCAADDALGQATRLYEESLHYYVSGLEWAGSPYAFHTIGSCVAISLYHYCLVRGFPKRAGGEDFYLLNKLAKLAPAANTTGTAIKLQARKSSRVPFGTGPAVEKILALDCLADFSTYDPRVFVELQNLLKHFRQLWQHKHQHAAWLASLTDNLRSACLALNISQLLFHLAAQADTEAQYQRHIHDWFDAFRTLKFIHFLQTRHYPPVAFDKALAGAERLFIH